MDKLANQIGYLVLKEDGAVVESGGELQNDERSANLFLDFINLTERWVCNSYCNVGRIEYFCFCLVWMKTLCQIAVVNGSL